MRQIQLILPPPCSSSPSITMFFIALHDTTDLLDAITPFTKLSNRFILKCSPTIFSLSASLKFPHPFTVQLQILPQFFSLFISLKPHHSLISLSYLYNTMFHMKLSHFSSMRLSFLHFIPLYLVARVNLYFTSPR